MNAVPQVPRGIRLNNPGCIELDGTKWQGMADVQADPTFVTFNAPEWGLRAIALILKSYEKRGIHTISAAITEWSPPSENPTAKYIADMCDWCAVGPKTILATLVTPAVLKGITRQECGEQPYDDTTVALGISLAGPDG